MKPKHTPGPWKFEKHSNAYEIWNQNTKIAVINEAHESELPSGTDLANGDLISAAPEMLDCADKLLNLLFDDIGLTREQIKLVHATGLIEAIKKARGES